MPNAGKELQSLALNQGRLLILLNSLAVNPNPRDTVNMRTKEIALVITLFYLAFQSVLLAALKDTLDIMAYFVQTFSTILIGLLTSGIALLAAWFFLSKVRNSRE
jgi:hypothetical protein